MKDEERRCALIRRRVLRGRWRRTSANGRPVNEIYKSGGMCEVD